MATNANETLPSLLQCVQELSVNGDEPPPRFIRKDLDEETPISHSLSDSIPIINLSLLSSPFSSSKEKETELAKLKSALTEWGFFQAVDHGVPTLLLDEVPRIGKEFFALPMQDKCKISNILEGKHEFLQGYGNDIEPAEDELCEWADRLNLMVKPFDQRNYKFWPTNPTRFRDIIDEYSMNVHLVAEIILKSMAISLGVKEDFFISPIKEMAPMSIMFNFYPPCSKPDLVYGIKPHTDSGAITILLQDREVEGLQILKGGQWVKVPIIPNALFVNIADQVEIMSNGVFKSVMHRVIPNSEKQRISVGMFFTIENETSLEPAMELISDTTPKLFKTMTSAEYGEIYVRRISQGLNTIDGARV